MNEPSAFEIHPGETILYRARHDHHWYLVAWKVLSGLIIVLVADLIVVGLVASWSDWLRIPLIGAVLLFSLGYVAEDILRLFIGDYVLTDQRFWTRAAPYAWSPTQDIPLDEIDSLSYRRDAIFLHRKGQRKLQVYLFPDGKLLAQAYKQATGKAAVPFGR